MSKLFFKNWLENQGGGLPAPKDYPIDPTPEPGQTNAFPDFHMAGSDELPPVKKQKNLKNMSKDKFSRDSSKI